MRQVERDKAGLFELTLAFRRVEPWPVLHKDVAPKGDRPAVVEKGVGERRVLDPPEQLQLRGLEQILGIKVGEIGRAGSGNDVLTCGAGSNTIVFGFGDGNDTSDGGIGGDWTDTFELEGVTGDFTQGDWALVPESGPAIQTQGANSLTLTDDAS